MIMIRRIYPHRHPAVLLLHCFVSFCTPARNELSYSTWEIDAFCGVLRGPRLISSLVEEWCSRSGKLTRAFLMQALPTPWTAQFYGPADNI